MFRRIREEFIDSLDLKITKIPTGNEWEFYYEQYKNVLVFLACNKATIGIRYMSFLFMFRHTVELYLKKQISTCENTHSIKELFQKIGGLPDDLLQQLELLKCEGDGSDFRYVTDKCGKQYFNYGILEILQPLEYFFNISGINIELENKPRGRFEIHTLYRTMGHVCTDYKESIYLILEGIKKNELSVNDIYIPLFYLIRHSIELSLKQNLLDAGENYLDRKKIERIKNEHSVCRLFNWINTIIKIALDNMSGRDETEIKFKQETENYHRDLRELQNIVHNIDNNSYYYMFPMDINGRPYRLIINEKRLLRTLKFLVKIDAYLCLAVPVLQEYGYLEINNDELF